MKLNGLYGEAVIIVPLCSGLLEIKQLAACGCHIVNDPLDEALQRW